MVNDASTDETGKQLDTLAATEPRLKVLHNAVNAGFVDSCNRGAAAATGEYLLFLNNDTVPLPGWLPPLLRTFELFADCGVAGGKLLFPDGRLQEAGGIIFADASAAHFGRNEPNASLPLFSYVRPVDYCSGALMLTPRQLFQDLGGFDPDFRPGYYEDTDYCFRVRQSGRNVYYQPEAVVVHLEGGTAGTDPGQGMKQYQALNLRRFQAKHAAALAELRPRPRQFDAETWRVLAYRGKSAVTS
ncbi:hypothetical protein BH11PLA2_BH11PLA2_17600 [soil metagenome]